MWVRLSVLWQPIQYARAKQATKMVKIVYQDVEPVIVTIQVMSASAQSLGHLAVSLSRNFQRILLPWYL